MEFVESVEETRLLVFLERRPERFRFFVLVKPRFLKLWVFEHVVRVGNKLDSIPKNRTRFRQADRKSKLHARPNFHVSFDIQKERKEFIQVRPRREVFELAQNDFVEQKVQVP